MFLKSNITHTSVYLGSTMVRSEPWVGGGRRERDVLFIGFPPNTAGKLLHVKTWTSLPESCFQKGLVPPVEPMPSALGKGAEVLRSS